MSSGIRKLVGKNTRSEFRKLAPRVSSDAAKGWLRNSQNLGLIVMSGFFLRGSQNWSWKGYLVSLFGARICHDAGFMAETGGI